MKKFYLISSLSVLSLSAISAANVNNRGTKKIRPSASQACQTTQVGTANVTVCVDGPVESSSLSREQLSNIQLVTSNLFKRHAKMNSKAWVSPGYAPSDDDDFTDSVSTPVSNIPTTPRPVTTNVGYTGDYIYAYYQTYTNTSNQPLDPEIDPDEYYPVD